MVSQRPPTWVGLHITAWAFLVETRKGIISNITRAAPLDSDNSQRHQQHRTWAIEKKERVSEAQWLGELHLREFLHKVPGMLLIYCCTANHSKPSGLKQLFGLQFGLGTAGVFYCWPHIDSDLHPWWAKWFCFWLSAGPWCAVQTSSHRSSSLSPQSSKRQASTYRQFLGLCLWHVCWCPLGWSKSFGQARFKGQGHGCYPLDKRIFIISVWIEGWDRVGANFVTYLTEKQIWTCWYDFIFIPRFEVPSKEVKLVLYFT